VPIIIPVEAITEIIAHAKDEEPYECCGVLLGKECVVASVHRATNVHEDRTRRFTIEPLDLLDAERMAGERSQEIVGFYHSHPRTEAYPSKTDIDNVVDTEWWEPVWAIVTLADRKNPVIRAFRIGLDRCVEEIVVETADARNAAGSS
jgi:proteasome lid subunit RPN8/RPN11